MAITVFSSFMDIGMAEHLRLNMLSLASNELKFRSFNNQKIEAKGWEITIQPQSLTLADAIYYSYSSIDTEFVAYVHIDIAVLIKNWDVLLINKITSQIPIVGVETIASNRHHNFPADLLLFCKTSVLQEINLDWRPILTDKILNIKGKRQVASKKIADAKESAITGLPIGSDLKLDGAWQLPYAYKNRGYSGATMKITNSSLPYNLDGIDTKIRKKFNRHLGIYIRDFELDGVKFGTHLGRSRRWWFDSPVAKIWTTAIQKYLEKSVTPC